MITPTSVSSRLRARPVMPWPRSIISLSMASARPSTRATPSPISRITPTLCFAVAAVTPAISASISRSRLLIGTLGHSSDPSAEALLQHGQRRAHAAVVDVAADLDAHPRDERGVLLEGSGVSRTVGTREAGLDAVTETDGEGGREIEGKGCRALHEGAMPREIQAHQAMEVRHDGQAAAAAALGNARGDPRGPGLVEQPVLEAGAEEAPRFASGSSWDLHGSGLD